MASDKINMPIVNFENNDIESLQKVDTIYIQVNDFIYPYNFNTTIQNNHNIIDNIYNIFKIYIYNINVKK
jgi:hypothetical protein